MDMAVREYHKGSADFLEVASGGTLGAMQSSPPDDKTFRNSALLLGAVALGAIGIAVYSAKKKAPAPQMGARTSMSARDIVSSDASLVATYDAMPDKAKAAVEAYVRDLAAASTVEEAKAISARTETAVKSALTEAGAESMLGGVGALAKALHQYFKAKFGEA